MDEFIQTAGQLADIGREIGLKYFRRQPDEEQKPDHSFVTQADQEIEAAMIEVIRKNHPDHGIRGEEYGAHQADAEFVWVLDPIDGTHNYIAGLPSFGSILGLTKNGRPILGVIEFLVAKERWLGITDQGSWLDDRPIKVRPTTKLKDAILAASGPQFYAPDSMAKFQEVCEASRLEAWGGNCIHYGLLASGTVDIVIEASLKPHDYLPVMPVVLGAGGVCSDWQGKELTFASEGKVLMSATKELHAEALEILNS